LTQLNIDICHDTWTWCGDSPVDEMYSSLRIKRDLSNKYVYYIDMVKAPCAQRS
jgi:hypothetical protein